MRILIISYLNTLHIHLRQHLVNDPHVLGESIQDSSRGVGVEEAHGGVQDVAEHVVVQGDGAARAHPQEVDRSKETQ